MKTRLLAAALVLVSTASLAEGMEMAQYGEVYEGPKTMTVELAPNKDGSKALVRITGVNHDWNNQVFLTDVKKVYNPYRVEYQTTIKGAPHTLLWTDAERSPATAVFLQPNGANPMANAYQAIPLSFDKKASLQLQTRHLLTDWEKQAK